MNLLLDTHILIWWATDDPQLPGECRRLLSDPQNEVFFSSINIWEVAIKHAQGRLLLPPQLLDSQARSHGLLHLPFTAEHAVATGRLPGHHQDPFDRALMAQALCEPMCLVSQDRRLRSYPVLLKYFQD